MSLSSCRSTLWASCRRKSEPTDFCIRFREGHVQQHKSDVACRTLHVELSASRSRDRLSPLQHHSPDIRQVQNLPAVNLGVVSPIGMLLLELHLEHRPRGIESLSGYIPRSLLRSYYGA